MKTIVVVSDLQVPYHNPRAVENLCKFIADFQPDELLNVGDDIDSPEPSRWNKGMAGEYAGTLQRSLKKCSEVHGDFRSALGADKPYHLSRSNHGDRVQTYIRRYAPALEGLDCLDITALLEYDKHQITFHRHAHQFAPRWLLMHGDEGGLSPTPGGTAASLCRSTGMSVVVGHTHKLGAQHITTGFNGRTSTRWGLETGHLMDIGKASYLKTGSANWQSGFAVLCVNGVDVSHNLVQVKPNGSFIYAGKEYK